MENRTFLFYFLLKQDKRPPNSAATSKHYQKLQGCKQEKFKISLSE